MEHVCDLPTRLCLFGDGQSLLNGFEQIRQAGVFGSRATLAGAHLAAAPVRNGQGGALESLAAREAKNLGIDWHADPAGLFAGAGGGLVLAVTPDAALPCALPPGWRLYPVEEAHVLLGLLVRAACPQACRPDMARARRLLSSVLDHLGDEVALLDPEDRLLDANARLVDRLGRPREELVGGAAETIFPDFPDMDTPGPEGRPSIRQALAAGRKANRESSRIDGRGRLRYFRTSFYPVSGQTGQVDHVAVVRRDITQDVFLERRLRKSERLAAIGELSMFISHEIRNPLFAIAGFANALLRAKDLGEASREKASIILTESKRLDDILKDIINFARPTSSKPGEADLGEVARRTTALMRHAMEAQGITVTLALSPETPMVRGDPDTLAQCLVNCLKNAQEAMPTGGHVVVSTGLEDGRAYLRVRDDGPGIAADVLPNVFNPFFTTRAKRAGLGLAMTKKILEDIGGTVELFSTPGQGTSVSLSLPPFLELAEEETGMDASHGNAGPKQVVLATRNAGKIRELHALLAPLGVTVLGLDAYPEIGEIPETGETFLENARLKARAVCQATGLVSIADDSGLCVDALSGAPGVYSARYSGENATDASNNAKLLAALAHVPDADRTCRFVSVVVAACPDGRELSVEGTWEGRVAFAPEGDGGFGYDPLFFDPTAGKTGAQLTPEEKNARSHRGKALAKLVAAWPGFWGKKR